MVSYYYAFNYWKDACYIPEEMIFDHSLICSQQKKTRRLLIGDFLPTSLQYTQITIASAAGTSDISYYPLGMFFVRRIALKH